MTRNKKIIMNITVQYLLLFTYLASHSALPHSPDLTRHPRGLDAAAMLTEKIANHKKEDCSNISDNMEDCQEDLRGSQLSPSVIICLNNCANCVKQWRTGVYNGRDCANDCMQQFEDPIESMDPDCNLLKYFNSTVIASV